MPFLAPWHVIVPEQLELSFTKRGQPQRLPLFLGGAKLYTHALRGSVVDKYNLQKSTKNVACLLARTADNSVVLSISDKK